MHCSHGAFPGIDVDGGFAEFLKTGARAVVKLDAKTKPQDIAALADAGFTAYHAVKKSIPLLYPGTYAVVIGGGGGLGHIGIQSLKALTAADVIVVDKSEATLDLAKKCGADHTVLANGSQVAKVKEIISARSWPSPPRARPCPHHPVCQIHPGRPCQVRGGSALHRTQPPRSSRLHLNRALRPGSELRFHSVCFSGACRAHDP